MRGPGAPAWQTVAEVALWFDEVPSVTPVDVKATQGKPTPGVKQEPHRA